MAKTSKQTICEIEQGSRRPNLWTLYSICDNLRLSSIDTEKVFRAFGHPSPTSLSAVGLHINGLRRNASITQGDMAFKVGVTRAAISKAEMGKKIVNEVAPLVYDFFEVPASERLKYEDNEHPQVDAVGEAVPEGEPSPCLG